LLTSEGRQGTQESEETVQKEGEREKQRGRWRGKNRGECGATLSGWVRNVLGL
jgi:hypothetical protein